MAVATIGAASLGPVFEELCDQVTQSMEKNRKLKTLLGFFRSTLNTLKERIIQPVQEGRQIFPDQEDMMESVVVELQTASKLIGKFSKLRTWHYLWLDDYTEELLELDRYFRGLMESTWVREFRVVRQQNRDVHHMIEEMLQRMFDAYNKALESEMVPPQTESVPEEQPSPEGEEGVEQAALLVFRTLFDAVREAEDKDKAPRMFRYLLSDIENTLYSLQPFVEEMAEHNKVLERPKEELRNLKVQMEKGIEMVRMSAGVGKKWEGYTKKKYECINGLLGLNQCLQRQVCILRWQMAKNATKALDLVRKMERAVNEIEGSVGVQDQAEVAGTS